MSEVTKEPGGRPPGLGNSTPLETVQTCLDDLIPGAAALNNEFDNSMIEFSDLKLTIDGQLRFPLDKFPALLKKRKTLRPRLRTTMPPPRQTTLRQSLLSLVKRNLGGSYVASYMDYATFAKSSLEAMLDVFGVEDWRARVRRFEPIVPNKESLVAWERLQNTSTLAAMERMDLATIGSEVVEDVADYEFILKAMPKAATDDKPAKVYQTVQTVMFHRKHVNAFYGPMVREADVRFRQLLRPEVLYNKGKNLDDMEKFLSEHYDTSGRAKIVENDFSDYDRSQREVAHCLDEALLAMLGFNSDDLALWMRGHYSHTNYNFQLGLKVHLLYQRKSGDVTTAFGNTVLNMVAVVFGMRLKRSELRAAMFLGDDSWLQLVDSEDLYKRMLVCSERIAVHFNGEAKTAMFKVGYFCGNYILTTNVGVKLAADPVKRAVKLGRWDVKTRDVLHENWVSFRDLLRNYEDEEVQFVLASAVKERMPKAREGMIKLLIEALNSVRASYKEFSRFYDDEVSETSY